MEACLTYCASVYCMAAAAQCTLQSSLKRKLRSHTCVIPDPATDDNNVTQEKECRASGKRFSVEQGIPPLWSSWRFLIFLTLSIDSGFLSLFSPDERV